MKTNNMGRIVYITERQLKEVYEKTLLEVFVINNNLVNGVKKYLDKNYAKIKYDDIDENGDVVEKFAVQRLSVSGQPLQTISLEKLLTKLDSEFSSNIKNENDRKKFLEQVVKDWLHNKISREGMLSVNYIKSSEK